MCEGWLPRLVFFLAIAVAAHLLLSRLGFSPTDDGFLLALSRRILNGQVPHRDFISIRPVGSAILHAAELALGGSHAFLLSRLFYWIQAATLCWCWMEIALRRSTARSGFAIVAPLIPLAFMLTTHAFPPMAWHTVDGVWLVSLGILACMGPSPRWRLAGYVLVGAAVTCKQNFVPLLPLAVIAHGDWRRPTAWLAVAVPAILYVVVLSGLGAAGDMRQQLFAYGELMGSGVKRYFAGPGWPAGLLVGAVSALAADRGARSSPRSGTFGSLASWFGFLALVVAIGAIGWTLDSDGFRFLDPMSFALLGCLCGYFLMSFRDPVSAPIVVAAALLAALAWSSGISFGYQTPAHVAGPLAILLLLTAASRLLDARGAAARAAVTVMLWVLTFVVAGHWWSARRDHIYNETTAPSLTHRLDGVIAGADGIVTSANTFMVLSDLRDLVARLHGRTYALVVDVPGWWACSRQANPLLADWPQSMELYTEGLRDRFSAHAVGMRGKTVFIVQKAQMTTLSQGRFPIGDSNEYYGAAVWMRHTFRSVEETTYWSVFE